MGFTTIIDILGSSVIGGLLLLILLRTNASAVQNTYLNGQDLVNQEDLTTVVEILQHDFRKIGYCKDWTKIDPRKAILSADSTSIKFLTDTQNNGKVDTLYYYLGPTSELSGTPNPQDRLLYRVKNNEVPKSSNLGITEFNLMYFDSFGDTLSFPITNLGKIASMQISVRVENPYAYNNIYKTAFWRQIRLAEPNLSNR